MYNYKWTLNTDHFRHGWSTYRYNIKNKSKVRPAPHLAVSVGVLLKVLLFTNDRLCDDVVILDTHSGREGGAVSLCQPGDLLGLLIILQEEMITKCYYLMYENFLFYCLFVIQIVCLITLAIFKKKKVFKKDT